MKDNIFIYGHTFPSGNKTAEEISSEIAKAILNSETIEINGNILTKEIIDAIKKTTTLKMLRLPNASRNTKQEEFLKAISENTSIIKLELSPDFEERHIFFMLGLGRGQQVNQNIQEISLIGSTKSKLQQWELDEEALLSNWWGNIPKIMEQCKNRRQGLGYEFDIGGDHCVRVTLNKESGTLTLLIFERKPMNTSQGYTVPGYKGHPSLTKVQKDEWEEYKKTVTNLPFQNLKIVLNAEDMTSFTDPDFAPTFDAGNYEGSVLSPKILEPFKSMKLKKVIFLSTGSNGNGPFHDQVLSLDTKALEYKHTFSLSNESAINSKIAHAISTLETIELDGDVLTDEIIEAIEKTTTLKKLVLRSPLKKISTDTSLFPDDSSSKDAKIHKFYNAIRKNKSITTLGLLKYHFSTEGVSEMLGLGKDQQVNQHIQKIYATDSQEELFKALIDKAKEKRIPSSFIIKLKRKDYIDVRIKVVDKDKDKELTTREAEGEQEKKDNRLKN